MCTRSKIKFALFPEGTKTKTRNTGGILVPFGSKNRVSVFFIVPTLYLILIIKTGMSAHHHNGLILIWFFLCLSITYFSGLSVCFTICLCRRPHQHAYFGRESHCKFSLLHNISGFLLIYLISAMLHSCDVWLCRVRLRQDSLDTILKVYVCWARPSWPGAISCRRSYVASAPITHIWHYRSWKSYLS